MLNYYSNFHVHRHNDFLGFHCLCYYFLIKFFLTIEITSFFYYNFNYLVHNQNYFQNFFYHYYLYPYLYHRRNGSLDRHYYSLCHYLKNSFLKIFIKQITIIYLSQKQNYFLNFPYHCYLYRYLYHKRNGYLDHHY